MEKIHEFLKEILPYSPILLAFLGWFFQHNLAKDLKKIEAKVNSYHILQIDVLDEIYTRLVDFHGVHRNFLFGRMDFNNHKSAFKFMQEWLNAYNYWHALCAKKKIFLPKELKKIIKENDNLFIKIARKFKDKIENYEMEIEERRRWAEPYEDIEDVSPETEEEFFAYYDVKGEHQKYKTNVLSSIKSIMEEIPEFGKVNIIIVNIRTILEKHLEDIN